MSLKNNPILHKDIHPAILFTVVIIIFLGFLNWNSIKQGYLTLRYSSFSNNKKIIVPSDLTPYPLHSPTPTNTPLPTPIPKSKLQQVIQSCDDSNNCLDINSLPFPFNPQAISKNTQKTDLYIYYIQPEYIINIGSELDKTSNRENIAEIYDQFSINYSRDSGSFINSLQFLPEEIIYKSSTITIYASKDWGFGSTLIGNTPAYLRGVISYTLTNGETIYGQFYIQILTKNDPDWLTILKKYSEPTNIEWYNNEDIVKEFPLSIKFDDRSKKLLVKDLANLINNRPDLQKKTQDLTNRLSILFTKP